MRFGRCIIYAFAFITGSECAEVLRQCRGLDYCKNLIAISLPTDCNVIITITLPEESAKDLTEDSTESAEDSEDFNPIYL